MMVASVPSGTGTWSNIINKLYVIYFPGPKEVYGAYYLIYQP